MRSSLLTTICLVFVAAAAAPAAAQAPPPKAPSWQVTLAPRFGVFLPNQGMGETETDGATLTMTSSPTAGLDIELRTPVRWLSMRAIAETSVGSRLAERATAASTLDCGTDCERSDVVTPIGESSVLTLVADAVVRPWGTASRFQPVMFGGAGVKRYDLTHGNRYVAGGQESALTFHYGGGLDVPLGPITLSFEAADYVSVFRSTIRPGTNSIFVEAEPAIRGRGILKHDFFLTLGVRLFPL